MGINAKVPFSVGDLRIRAQDTGQGSEGSRVRILVEPFRNFGKMFIPLCQCLSEETLNGRRFLIMST